MLMDISQYTVKINGVELDPQPDFKGGLIWSLQDIQSADSGRAEDGTMIINYVGSKRKLQFKWSNKTMAQIESILELIPAETVFFPVTYYDPQNRRMETRTFYKGDRSMDWYSFRTDVNASSFSFNVIER